jgi:tetratricopeptide (TPR) repeat protein
MAERDGRQDVRREAEGLDDELIDDCRDTSSDHGGAYRPQAPPVAVPGYEVLAELGRGGMGVVYKARQTALNGLVALKLILHADHAGPAERQRFRAEAEAVARLQHPNIVQIYEAGEHQGKPFCALELVEGGSLDRKLRGAPVAHKQAAQIVETLARAVQAAHAAGVVHRDLKPANVLVGGGWALKVTDFGLARRLDQAGQTASGAVLGTPSYMAPEQASGKGKEAGPAADVYALGAILYELLTGRPPFRAANVIETLAQVVNDEPVPPSRLNSKTPRDLEVICLKCLNKEPRRRYPSAEKLADDLKRFRAGEPIHARPVGRLERLAKWCRRKPALAVSVGLAAAALACGTVVSTAFGVSASQAQKKTRGALETAEEAKARAETAQGTAETQRDLAQGRTAESYLDRGLTACARENDEALGLLWMCRALEAAPEKDRGQQERARTHWTAWRHQVHPLRAVFSLADKVTAVAFSPDGKTALTGSEDGTARLWDVATGRPVGEPMRHEGKVEAAAFSPDGRTALTAAHDARLWDVATCRPLGAAMHHDNGVSAAAFSPDGKTILTSDFMFRKTRLWDAATARPLGRPMQQPSWASRQAFSPDGKTVLTLSDNTMAQLWDGATGQALGPPVWDVHAVAFAADGKGVLAVGADGTVRRLAVPVPPVGDAALLTLWTQVQTGAQLDQHGAPQALDVADWQERRQRLAAAAADRRMQVPDSGFDRASLERDDQAWRETQAKQCEQSRQWFAAAFHLSARLRVRADDWRLWSRRGWAYLRLAEWDRAARDYAEACRLNPQEADLRGRLGYVQGMLGQYDRAFASYTAAIERKDDVWWYWAERADFYAETGRWAQASADLARAARLAPDQAAVWYRHGLSQLAAGDFKGYRETCTRLLAHFADARDAGACCCVAWVGALAPDAGLDPVWLRRFAERAATSDPTNSDYLLVLGVALYRAREYGTAVERLNQAVANQGQGGRVESWLFLALAHQRLGHDEEARRWLDKAVAWIDQRQLGRPEDATGRASLPWQDRLQLILLCQEAKAAVRGGGPKP